MKRLLLVGLFLVACKKGGSETTPGNGTGTATGTDPVQPTGDQVVLVELSMGDAACYVTIRDAGGEETLAGTYDLCEGGENDASALIGKPVTITKSKVSMMAASCEGDPECPDKEVVDAVTAITAAE
jgi:hypothetical protein